VTATAPDPTFVEWLQLKSHVVDPATGRLTLPAVLEDVRRLLADHDVIGLVYVDLSGGVRLEAEQGWQAYDEMVAAAARALDVARAEHILGETDIVAPLGPRSDKLVVFAAGAPRLPLQDGELETRAFALRNSITEALRPFGRSATAAPPLVGIARLERDPMLRTERAVHRALDEAMFMSLCRRGLEDQRLAQWLDRVIETESVLTFFQPILDLRAMTVQAQEATTHGPAGGLAEAPEALFALAERTGRGLAFERLCRKHALHGFGRSESHAGSLFLKVSATAVNDPSFATGGFGQELEGTGIDAAEVVVELAERVAAHDRNVSRAAVRSLKAQGFRVAIDDMGAGYSSLGVVADMEPDFLKFDMALVRRLDTSPIKRSLLETVVQLSEKVQAPVVACGIETAGELAVIREMGVPLGQGRHLSPPVPLPPSGAR
jgi:EAL domain-containing protein (putative c-di-GMP-specific phosphodiesterase class I)